jgi:hypothetical protein
MRRSAFQTISHSQKSRTKRNAAGRFFKKPSIM